MAIANISWQAKSTRQWPVDEEPSPKLDDNPLESGASVGVSEITKFDNETTSD